MMDPLLIGLVSACTALVASIVGPLVTLTVAKRQINATVLSANRQKWIENLREALAELISLLVTAVVVKAKWKDNWRGGYGPLIEDANTLEKLRQIVLAQSKIRLLLNPTESDHQRLHALIEDALKHIQSEQSPDPAIEADIQAITELAQAILKREWQRVKRGI